MKQTKKVAFSTRLRRAVQLTVFVVDGDRFDALVDDLEPVDDRGVAIPGQVDGVCRCPL